MSTENLTAGGREPFNVILNSSSVGRLLAYETHFATKTQCGGTTGGTLDIKLSTLSFVIWDRMQ